MKKAMRYVYLCVGGGLMSGGLHNVLLGAGAAVLVAAVCEAIVHKGEKDDGRQE